MKRMRGKWTPTGKAGSTSPHRSWGGILSKGSRLKAVVRVEGSMHSQRIALCVLFFIIFLGLMDIDVWGEEWKFSTQSENGTMYYYDATRVTEVSEGVIRFWGKALLSPEAVKRLVKIDPKFAGSDHINSLIEMNCTERKRRPLWIIIFDKNRVAIENEEITLDQSEWEIVLPGSVQEDILDALCKKK